MNLETDFDYKTLELVPDYEGKVIATFISSKLNTGKRASVLYIHGFIDYFFHPHLSKEFTDSGFDFHALDLRKYGRSLLPHQHPNYCKNIEEYFEELTIAVNSIKKKNDNPLHLLGHSTGGLLVTKYMNSGEAANCVDGLILNSPFFAFNESTIENKLIPIVAKIVSFFAPYAKIMKGLSPVYAHSIHKSFNGEWDYNFEWKPIEGFPTYFRWLYAISKAQNSLHNSDINVPILIIHSSRSGNTKISPDDAMSSDIVLNIEDMKSIGTKLADNVSFAEIHNGLHDIFLSRKETREEAFKIMFNWLSLAH